MTEIPAPAPAVTPRVVACLNRALHEAFGREDSLFLLGEDVADPYGGAFKVTAGLSTAYPDRVLATPLSEGGILGMASGLAISGHPVIVEIMFGDFIGLVFDQLLNLVSKSVSMYGQHTAMRVVLRCPVGGRRGYGPTHSQNPQKHLIGIPHLALYELSPFHQAGQLLTHLLERDEPSVLFEDKVTYTERIFPGAAADRRYRRDFPGRGNWAHLYAPADTGRPPVALIAPGGVGRRALDAATALAGECNLDVHVLVPARLYPVDIEDILDHLIRAEAIWVAEEGTAGGTWGSEVAARVHAAAWDRLRAPVWSVSSADSVIPAAPHLEREVILQADTIVRAVRSRLPGTRQPAGNYQGSAAGTPAPDASPARGPGTAADGRHPIRVPKINSNDGAYVLDSWLAAAGEQVLAGQPVAEIETSKTVQELTAAAAGILTQDLAPGAECRPGEVIGHLTGPDIAGTAVPVTSAGSAEGAVPAAATSLPAVAGQARILSATQRRVADVVTAAHREIPSAFAVARVVVDEAMELASKVSQQCGAPVGLTEITVKALGALHAQHPLLYGTLREDGTVAVPDTANVGVTVDVGTGLYIPVIPGVAARSLEEIADILTGLRMRALRGQITTADLEGATIALSLTAEAGIVLVHPLVPPGLASIVSLAAPQQQPWPDGRGGIRLRWTAEIGLAHDHRFVNGRDAAVFLAGLRSLLENPELLE